MTRALPTCAATLALACLLSAAPPTFAMTLRYALIIGNDYSEESELPALRHAERDARRVADALRRYAGVTPERSVVLTGPTRASVAAAARHLAARRAEDAAQLPGARTMVVECLGHDGCDDGEYCDPDGACADDSEVCGDSLMHPSYETCDLSAGVGCDVGYACVACECEETDLCAEDSDCDEGEYCHNVSFGCTPESAACGDGTFQDFEVCDASGFGGGCGEGEVCESCACVPDVPETEGCLDPADTAQLDDPDVIDTAFEVSGLCDESDGADGDCAATVLAALTGLSETCGACVADAAACGLAACPTECASNPSEPECANCLDDACGLDFTACAGVDYPGTTCQPACDGATCGADGCGGSCGSCGAGSSCQGGTCVAVEAGQGGSVVDAITVSEGEGYDVDGDGSPDNGLAALIALLSGFATIDVGIVNDAYASALASGDMILLLSLTGVGSLSNDASVGGASWIGVAAGGGDDPLYTLDPATVGPDGEPVHPFSDADIASGDLSVLADSVPIWVPRGLGLTGEAGVIQVDAVDVILDGALSAAPSGVGYALDGGHLAGVLPLAGLADVLDVSFQDCACLGLGGEAAVILASEDKLGCSSAFENGQHTCDGSDPEACQTLQTNSALLCIGMGLISPDIDSDGNGTADGLSFIVELSAVGAEILGLPADDCEPDCIPDPDPICGDGIFQPSNDEACDDGDADNTNGCDTDCEVVPYLVPEAPNDITAWWVEVIALADGGHVVIWLATPEGADNATVHARFFAASGQPVSGVLTLPFPGVLTADFYVESPQFAAGVGLPGGAVALVTQTVYGNSQNNDGDPWHASLKVAVLTPEGLAGPPLALELQTTPDPFDFWTWYDRMRVRVLPADDGFGVLWPAASGDLVWSVFDDSGLPLHDPVTIADATLGDAARDATMLDSWTLAVLADTGDAGAVWLVDTYLGAVDDVLDIPVDLEDGSRLLPILGGPVAGGFAVASGDSLSRFQASGVPYLAEVDVTGWLDAAPTDGGGAVLLAGGGALLTLGPSESSVSATTELWPSAPAGDAALTATAGGFAVAWPGEGGPNTLRVDPLGMAMAPDPGVTTWQACDEDCTDPAASCTAAGVCASEPSPEDACGDGIAQLQEACDDGTPDGYDGCNACAVGEQQLEPEASGAARTHQRSVAALEGGGYVVVWRRYLSGTGGQHVFARRYDEGGWPMGAATEVSQTGPLKFDSPEPAVAPLNGGGFVVVWHRKPASDGTLMVLGRLYGADGEPLGDELQLSADDGQPAYQPAVAQLMDGGFVVVFTRDDPDGDQNIYGAKFWGSGALDAGPKQLNYGAVGDQSTPAVVDLGGGHVAVAWRSEPDDGIHQRRFASNNLALPEPPTGHIEWNPGNASGGLNLQGGSGFNPALAAQPNGGWVLAAEIDHPTHGRVATVNLRSATGVDQGLHAPFGADLPSQQTPSIAALPDGTGTWNWVLVASPNDADSEGRAVLVYDTHSEEVRQLNLYETNDQMFPAVAAQGVGSIMAVWSSWGQDGADHGVYGRRTDIFGGLYPPAPKLGTCATDDACGSSGHCAPHGECEYGDPIPDTE